MQSFERSTNNGVEMRLDEAAAILRDVQFLIFLAASEENTRTYICLSYFYQGRGMNLGLPE